MGNFAVGYYDLGGSNKCSLRRNHNIVVRRGTNKTKKRTRIEKEALGLLFSKTLDIADLQTYLYEQYDGLFESDVTRKIMARENTAELARYFRSEFRVPVEVEPMNITVFGDIEVKDVKPDLFFVSNDKVEAVQLRCSKPSGDMGSEDLYILEKYAEQFIETQLKPDPNTNFQVFGSRYFLRKGTDKLTFNPSGDPSISKKNNFDNNFWRDGNGNETNNVVRIGRQFSVGQGNTAFDVDYQERFNKIRNGIDKDECTEEECAYCDFNEICHYQHSPVRVIHEKVVRSIRDMNLSTVQEEIMEKESGVMRINAGAGAGKTLVISLRVVSLLLKGVKPNEICVMTFTNTGANEFKERIQLYNNDFGTGDDISELVATTFHAFGYEILKEEYQRFGYTSSPHVIDDVDRSIIIAKLLAKHDVDGLDYRNFRIDTKNCKGALAMAKAVFALIKENRYTVADVDVIASTIGTRFCSKEAIRQLVYIYDEYEQILIDKNLIEFADQEAKVFELLESDPYYLDRYGFKHIIVDEAQDTSMGQIEMIKFMMQAPSFESLMFVGDDSQSIYGSIRNTSPKYLINIFDLLGLRAGEGEDFYLVDNYRSTPEIVDFANAINDKNKNKIEKTLKASRPASGIQPVVRGFQSKDLEYEYIIEKIKEKLANGAKYEDIAFLAGTKTELAKMASLLSEENIPSVLLNPEVLIENSRVKAAIHLAKYMMNPEDTESILACINAEMLGNLLIMTDEDIIECIKQKQAEAKFIRSLPDAKQKEEFLKMLEKFDEEDEVYESFVETLESKPSMSQILEYCEHFEEYGAKNAFRRTSDYPGIVLITAHSSKGLEWPIIFNSIDQYDDASLGRKEDRVEEKRRLLFVSATRARDELYITGTYVAYGNRKSDPHYNRFLVELYNILGMSFNVADIEREYAEMQLEKARKRREEKKKLLERLKNGETEALMEDSIMNKKQDI